MSKLTTKIRMGMSTRKAEIKILILKVAMLRVKNLHLKRRTMILTPEEFLDLFGLSVRIIIHEVTVKAAMEDEMICHQTSPVHRF